MLNFVLISLAFCSKAFGVEEKNSLVDSNASFGWNLYEQVSRQEGNFVFSPYALFSSLGVLSFGAQEATYEQMLRALHLASPRAYLIPSLTVLHYQVAGENLTFANALWLQEELNISQAFQRAVRRSLLMETHLVNFAERPDSARFTMNHWVAEKTKGKVRFLIQPHDVDRTTKIVLVAFSRLKEKWKQPFSGETREEPFNTNSRNTVIVPFLETEGEFFYGEDEAFSVLEVPYASTWMGGRQLAMLVFLPRSPEGINEVEGRLRNVSVASILGKMRKQVVRLTIPKFEITNTLHLSDVLADVGMSLALSYDANFGGISKQGNLYLSRVIHNASFSIDEKGTGGYEPGIPATAVQKEFGAIERLPFRVDRPFLFMIVDKGTAATLFMGRIINPATS